MSQGELFDAVDAPEARDAVPRTPTLPHAPVDAGEREAAVTVFDRPLLVEAGAGTGKTATLVARVLCWCLGAGWERARREALGADERAALSEDERAEVAARTLGGVVAITFTEAAAAEMAGRVAEGLEQAERAARTALAGGTALDPERLPRGLAPAHLPADPERCARRARALRANLDRLEVATIHSFCRRLLAAHPLEAGLAPHFEVDAEWSALARFAREALTEGLEEAWTPPLDPDLLLLAERGTAPPALEEALVTLAEQGAHAADLAADPLDEATCGELLDALGDPLAALAVRCEAFAGLPRSQRVHDVRRALAETALALAADDAREGTARARLEHLLALLPDVWDGRAGSLLQEWAKEKLGKRERAALEGDDAAFPALAARFAAALAPLRRLDPAFLNAARRLLHAALVRVEEKKRRAGVLSFPDLLEGARALLATHPGIAARERRRIGQLLVDEFQDTDLDQCAIVRALALEGAPEERPSLFLVGDPKQSIFSWRNADLEAYDGFKDLVGEAGGEVLTLRCNFRSTPAVLEEVERLVAPVMEEEHGVQPAFVPLSAHRAGAGPVEHAIEHWTSWPADPASGAVRAKPGTSRVASYRTEARALAAAIHARRDAQPWSQVAILFRSLTGLEPYLEELRRAGIPFEVSSDRSYYRRREVIDADALVRAVLDPTDALALLTLLRSPMVGMPDAAVAPLWRAELPGIAADLADPADPRLEALAASVRRVAAELPPGLPGHDGIAGWEEAVVAALRNLARARAAFEREPADAWTARLRRLFLPDALEATRYLGAHRTANLERFFAELLRQLEQRAGDVRAVLRGLRQSVLRNDTMESGRPADAAGEAVRILTIHGAKGLEFAQVYLAQMHKGDGGGPGDRTRFERRAGRVAYRLCGAPSPALFHTEPLRERTERAERVRLLYVALTRARDRLCVLNGWHPEPARKGWDAAGTFRELLEHRPGGDEAVEVLVELAETDPGAVHVDAAGVAWRLAAGLAPGEDAARADARAQAEPLRLRSPAALRAADAALTERRHAARSHARRPFHGTASGRVEHAGGPADDDAPRRPTRPRDLDPRAVGSAVHALLERLAGVPGDAEALTAALARELEALPGDLTPAEAAEVRAVVEGLPSSGLLERLASVTPHVIARELPVLLPPGPGEAEPVGFVGGSLDLVHRDPASGELVIVDYKTDRVAAPGDPAALARLAETYRPQGALYARALQEALDLPAPPRFELWLLRTGDVVDAS